MATRSSRTQRLSCRHNRRVALTPRQTFLLRKVVEAHRDLDQPIGSKWIAEQDDVPWGPSTVRAELANRVEVLLLQPQVAMVVIITSTGGVTKRVISYDAPVDPGLVEWASSYLNEALGGLDVGSRTLQSRLQVDGRAEQEFLRTLTPAFTELEETA